MRRFCLFLLASPLWCQISYVAQKTTSLSGAAEVVTIQQRAPASSNRFVDFKTAYIDCSVACTVTLERNGTFASTTALTIANVNPGETATTVTAYSASNVGTGTVIQVVSIQAGGYLVFGLDNPSINLKSQGGTSENFTLRTSSITGTVHITINWTERQ